MSSFGQLHVEQNDRGRSTQKGGNWVVIVLAVLVIGGVTMAMHVTVSKHKSVSALSTSAMPLTPSSQMSSMASPMTISGTPITSGTTLTSLTPTPSTNPSVSSDNVAAAPQPASQQQQQQQQQTAAPTSAPSIGGSAGLKQSEAAAAMEGGSANMASATLSASASAPAPSWHSEGYYENEQFQAESNNQSAACYADAACETVMAECASWTSEQCTSMAKTGACTQVLGNPSWPGAACNVNQLTWPYDFPMTALQQAQYNCCHLRLQIASEGDLRAIQAHNGNVTAVRLDRLGGRKLRHYKRHHK